VRVDEQRTTQQNKCWNNTRNKKERIKITLINNRRTMYKSRRREDPRTTLVRDLIVIVFILCLLTLVALQFHNVVSWCGPPSKPHEYIMVCLLLLPSLSFICCFVCFICFIALAHISVFLFCLIKNRKKVSIICDTFLILPRNGLKHSFKL
jgi:hypothetical protein